MEKKKGTKGRRRRMQIALSFVLMIVVWASLILWEQQSELADKQERLQELTSEKNKLTDERLRLQKAKEKLQDPEYIGELARKNYYMSKPGEKIFITSNPRQ